MKILHLIPSLENGGAERMLSELALSKDLTIENTICCLFKREGWYDKKLNENNIKVIKLSWSLTTILPNIFYLIKIFRQNDIVQCWLYYAMFVGTIIGIVSRKKIVWNIRQSAIEKKHLKGKIYYLVRVLKYMSWYPTAIISCSERTLKNHKKIGYSDKNMIFIPNFTSYAMTHLENKKISNKFNSEIYLCVGRSNKIKNHENLIKAFNEFVKTNKGSELWIVGYTGEDTRNIKYFEKTKKLSFFYNSAKFYISSSYSEGFPNVLIESMIHGTPVITTDAGDSYNIIENTGIKIDGFNYKNILNSLHLSNTIDFQTYKMFCEESVQIVSEKYTSKKVLDKYINVYKEVISV